MPDAVEASLPAPVAGYGARQAVIDLLAGARYARWPVRRREGELVPWSWLILLLALAGMADGLDVYLRDPFRAADVPAELRPHLGLVNLVSLPLLSILAVLIAALVFVAGAKVLLPGSLRIRQIATAVILGIWAAVLPMLLAAGFGGGIGLSTDLVATITSCVMLGYVAPSLAEMADVSIGRAVAALLLGPIVLLLGVVAAMLAFGFSAKIAGYRL